MYNYYYILVDLSIVYLQYTLAEAVAPSPSVVWEALQPGGENSIFAAHLQQGSINRWVITKIL